jgi:hypothetical protein
MVGISCFILLNNVGVNWSLPEGLIKHEGDFMRDMIDGPCDIKFFKPYFIQGLIPIFIG